MQELKTFVKETTFLERSEHMDFGWGNGYVIIPNGHPLHGMHYYAINKLLPNGVHGGLTFSEHASDVSRDWRDIPTGYEQGWVVGFDTCHAFDTLKSWSKEAVINETEKLKLQLTNLKP